MLPLPSSSCVAATVGLSSLLALGLATSRASLSMFAGAGFVLIAAAYARTFPLARRARAERLEFAWWLSQRASGPDTVLVPGVPIEVHCFVRHRGARDLRLSHLVPVLPEGLVVTNGRGGALVARACARADFAMALEARSVGRFVAQGLAARVEGPFGLFSMPLYFPHPLPLKVLPRVARRAVLAAPRAPESTGARAGRSRPRRRGGGTELRELRELVPGDPFKSIAWKTSARLGKLVVREVEHEVDELHFVALDVSPSMREGALGRRKIDAALDAVATLATTALRDGDRFAAALFDRRIVGHVPKGEGKAHLLRTFDLLLSAMEVVDDDLTEVDDRAVSAYVGRHLQKQMGLDFRGPADERRGRGSASGAVTPAPFPKGLLAHVRSLVVDDLGAVRSSAPEGRLLRRYCQLRGLALPYHAETSEAEKTAALLDALALAHKPGAPPSEITIVTDGEALDASDALLRRLAALRAHGHRIRFVLVDAAAGEEATTDLERALADVRTKRASRRIASLRVALARSGIATAVLPATHGEFGSSATTKEQAA